MPDFVLLPFMVQALLVGAMLAVIIPCVGIIIVLKRQSMMGDTLAHSSLAGVAFGLLLGWDPTVGAMVLCVAGALSIEWIRKFFPQYEDIALAIIMSTFVGLAGVLSGYVSNMADFNNFLFGSIVAIAPYEFRLVMGISAAVLVTFVLLYRELFYIAFDERGAKLAGIPVGRVNFVFTILTAVTVAVASRTVGALIVSSMLVIPVACAMQWGKSYFQTVLLAIGFALFFMLGGLTLSFVVQNLKPGGTIVLIGVGVLLVSLLTKRWRG